MTQSETWCKMTVKKMQIRHKIFHLKLLLSWNSTRVAKKVCVASHNNHPTSLASSWDISFLKSLVQQDPKGSNKVAHLFILDVYVSPNRKYINLSLIYYILDFSFFMSQDDAYFHIHQNDPDTSSQEEEDHGSHWANTVDQTRIKLKYLMLFNIEQFTNIILS